MSRSAVYFLVITLLLGGCAPGGASPSPAAATATSFQPLPATASEPPAPATSTRAPATEIPAIPDAATLDWTPLASSFTRPVLITHAGDERLFVVEQRGVIWILKGGERLAEPFLDIRAQVEDRGNEQGLLGLAFHPDFGHDGTFYLD